MTEIRELSSQWGQCSHKLASSRVEDSSTGEGSMDPLLDLKYVVPPDFYFRTVSNSLDHLVAAPFRNVLQYG
jgi:hypothetical protein